MRPNHTTTTLRDPNCWRIKRGGEAGDFTARNEITGRSTQLTLALDGKRVWIENHAATETDCSCYVHRIHGECSHRAVFIALSRFLAREAEKQSTSAEERKARAQAEIEECFR